MPPPKPLVPAIVVKTQLVYPDRPTDFLDCKPEPKLDPVTDDVAFAKWAQDVREKGAECRNNLGAIRAWIQSWPELPK